MELIPGMGKGMWLWVIRYITPDFDADLIADMCADLGLDHLIIKVANGVSNYNLRWNGTTWVDDILGPVVEAVQAKGIKVLAYHYVFGTSPSTEAQVIVNRINQFGLGGLVVNAESEYRDLSGNDNAARSYMNYIRSELGEVFPVWLSTYRWPSYHPSFPYEEFLERMQGAMPQVYWIHGSNPGGQLERSLEEYQDFAGMYDSTGAFKPFVPTGPAFTEHGWTPTVAELDALNERALALDLPGINWWEMRFLESLGFYEPIKAHDWSHLGDPEPPPPDPEPGPVEMSLTQIVDGNLNVRRAPSGSATWVRSLRPGEVVQMYDFHKSWARISPADAPEEWCHGYWLKSQNI